MKNLQQNVIQTWGDAGRAWLAQLPERVAALAQKWNLRDLKPVTPLSYNYVLKGIDATHHVPIVLKLSCDPVEFMREVSALTIYNGNACIKLLAHDVELGAMLLEQAIPGITLKSLFPQQDSRALEHTVAVMNHLHAAVVPDNAHDQFPVIAQWLQELHTTVKISGYHLEKAQDLAKDLLQTSAPSVLLHGDLHHNNVISVADRWVAIDPKGVLGEPLYEIGAFVRNPIPELIDQPDVVARIARRLDHFSDILHADRQRVKAWCYVQALLIYCWSSPASDESRYWLFEAEVIDKL